MADASSTADSAARLDPVPRIAKPACPLGHGAGAQHNARTVA